MECFIKQLIPICIVNRGIGGTVGYVIRVVAFMAWVMPEFIYVSSATFTTENFRTSGQTASFLNTLVVLVVSEHHKDKVKPNISQLA